MQHTSHPSAARKRIALVAAASLAALTLVPMTATAAPTPQGSPKDKAIAAANAAVNSKLQASDGSKLELQSARLEDGKTSMHYMTYERKIDGKEVVGGETIVAATGSGEVKTVNKENLGELPRKVTAKISADEAKKVAAKQIEKADQVGKPELVVYARDIAKPVSAFAVNVIGTKKTAEGTMPSNMTVYVDAQSGKVVATDEQAAAARMNGLYAGQTEIDTQPGKMVSNEAKGFSCSNQQRLITGQEPWGNGRALDDTTTCADVTFAAEQENKMLKDWMGTDSGMDGNGRWIPAKINLNDVNAFYNGQTTNYGFNKARDRNLTQLDIVAHEYGHGIIGHRGSRGQGGVGEAMADTLATITEFYAAPHSADKPDYDMGELVDLRGDKKPLRNMSDPSLRGDPPCYDASVETMEVHKAAGPLSHAFYLMAEGTNPTNGQPSSKVCKGPQTLKGIGIKEAGRIAYNSLSLRTSNKYAPMRLYFLQSAKNLFPNNCHNFNVTKAALDATNFPAQPGEPTCQGPDTPDTPPTSQPPTSQPPSSNPPNPPTTVPPTSDKPAPPAPSRSPKGDPTSGSMVLENGKAKKLNLSKGKQMQYLLYVPQGAKNVKVGISGDNGDADLYISRKGPANYDNWECRPFLTGSVEDCSWTSPKGGKLYIMVDGTEPTSNLDLEATWEGGVR